ncbi:hypothetical protein RHSIM_Rhsim06G0120600 [Rhododendron simsii]|uniref:Uncharacterized protein n=1 Tax=Rhododendron simsii TaxID=118357 RepID=A0A834GQB0_RHOSS|nr:hypothetical protein RHSIM_Rhsim06G0120600 [Rhododendron simsii]
MKMGVTADGRISQLYYNGVTLFIQFARAVVDAQGNILCPCLKCVNFYRKSPEDVRIHLLQHGIMQSYTIWNEHGETRKSNDVRRHEMRHGDLGGIDALVEDRIRGEPIDTTQHHEEVQNFDKLLNDAQREIYPGSKDYNLLKFVIEVFNMKVTNHWTNKSLDMFLKFQIKLLPEGNLVPKNTYEARKILSGLGLSYELIDACINDCILFWKENAALDRCPKCNVSRYKINCTRGKKIARKILRYFPLTPRLKRLFMSRAIAKAMRWHMNNPTDGEESGHLAHSDEWKEFDVKHPEFACEARNVRLGIATDGFNPFGNMSNSYSIWPVILIPYNLPPWLVMKDSFFMLTLLIPGDKQPGIDIDVYLRPLVDELKELWHTGTLTYDAASCEWFQMRAAFWWTLHDWPALGDISGWRTKGHYSCYTCNDEPYFESLRSKTAYTNHRAYLPEDHAERRKRLAYNGKPENRKRSLELPVEKIREQLNNVSEVILGKNPANKKRKRHKPNWTKRSILYELTYVEDRKLLHNIDVMHCEKNFSENIVGTMLGIDGKNKDTDKARKDLEDKGIRKDMWLTQRPDGSYVKPCASFALTLKEREAFFEFLKSVKYPDGYAANISRSVSSTNGRLTGLQSHDYHILIQQILPIGMRGFVDKEISTTLFELGSFFQDLCSKTLRRSELEKLEERIVLILCKLEKIFPPAFFDVMVHLAVHLPREAILGGPVHYRWMYPIERFLGTLKQFVSNRARPEGSIAEAYIVKECITFCSMYLDEVETVHNRPQRNEDFGERRKGYTVNWLRANKSTEATDELWSLANGPNLLVKEYYGCITNGFRFRTREVDDRLLLFQCEWYNTGNIGRNGTIRTDKYCTSINVKSRWCQSDPFILPSQAKQVFYLNDTKWGEPWQVVQLVKQRGVFDVPKVGDGEPLDPPECTDAFQQESMTSGVPIDIEGNIRFRREDAEVEVIAGVGALHETIENLIDDEVDEELEIIGEDINDEAGEDHEISDADMDADMDYDVLKQCCLCIVHRHAKKSRGEKVLTNKKQEKVMLQPNFLATHYKTHYERIRDEKIKRNKEVLESLGVKKIATSMMGSARFQCANDNGKRGRADQVDDPDYILSNDEDGHGYNSESDDSFEQEDIEIPPGGLPAQSHTVPQCDATLISERVTRSTPHPSMESQASLQAIAQPQNEVLPENNGEINRPTRGPTRGIQAQRLIDKQRKLPVPIPQLFRASVGKHAAQLASRIGVEVRTHVIDLGVPRWKAVDESVKAPILQRIMDKFDLQGDPVDVKKAVATQCGRRLSNHNFVLHKKYKKLKETRGEEYARNNPPAGVNPEQWTSLVTKKWTVLKWLERSEKNISNRSWSKTKHRCGSKSLPVRVAAAMHDNGGVVPAVTEMYKSTHFNEDTQKWISSESKVLYDKMVQIEIEHNAQDGAISITQEELSVKGLKARSGYVKGLGIRPSSSIRTGNGEYVTHLEGKVQEQAEKIQKQAEKIQEQAEGIEAANNKIDELALAKEEQGKTLANVMAFLKQQGFTG